MKIITKIIKGFAILFLLLLFIIIGLNCTKYAIYSDYYNDLKIESKIPGLNDGFVPQGITVSEKNNAVLLSGYMTKGNSRIYIVKDDKYSHFIELPLDGHCAGLAVSGNKLFLGDKNNIYILNLDDVLGDRSVSFENMITITFNASYAYCDDTYLYVGEFNNDKEYVTNHKFETDEGTYSAIIAKYDLATFETAPTPIMYYSVRNLVQGAVILEDKVILSTSWGVNSSNYYIYNPSENTNTGTLDGIEVKFLDTPEYKISGPAMSEGLDYSNGYLYCVSESASSRYIFGKLFNADYIIMLKID